MRIHRLRDLRASEVSIVSSPAVGRKFLLRKSADGDDLATVREQNRALLKKSAWTWREMDEALHAAADGLLDEQTADHIHDALEQMKPFGEQTLAGDAPMDYRATVLSAFALPIQKSAVEMSAHDACHAEIEVEAHRAMRADPWLTPPQARAQIIKSSRGSALLGLASGPLGHLRLGDALARLEGQHPDALAAMANAISGPNGQTSSISKSIRRNSRPGSTKEGYSQFKRRVAAELNGEGNL